MWPFKKKPRCVEWIGPDQPRVSIGASVVVHAESDVPGCILVELRFRGPDTLLVDVPRQMAGRFPVGERIKLFVDAA